MTVRQLTLNEVDDPCRICKGLGDDDQIPKNCPLLLQTIPDRCYIADRVFGSGC